MCHIKYLAAPRLFLFTPLRGFRGRVATIACIVCAMVHYFVPVCLFRRGAVGADGYSLGGCKSSPLIPRALFSTQRRLPALHATVDAWRSRHWLTQVRLPARWKSRTRSLAKQVFYHSPTPPACSELSLTAISLLKHQDGARGIISITQIGRAHV